MGVANRLTALVVALCAGALLLPAASIAAPAWTGAVNYPLPYGAGGAETQVGFSSGGVATLAYRETTGTYPNLHVGTTAPGGAYTEQTVTTGSGSAEPESFQLRVEANGAAVLEWTQLDGDDPLASPVSFEAIYRAPGSVTWGAPITLFTDNDPAGGLAATLVPALAADGTGAAAVDVIDPALGGTSPGYELLVADVTPSGAWSPTAQLASGLDKSAERVALGYDSSDNLTAVYDLGLSSGDYGLAVQTLTEGSGSWSSPQQLTGSGGSAETPALAVAPDGSAVIAFQFDTAPATGDLKIVTRPSATATWSAPADVVPGGAALAAAVSPTGDETYVVYDAAGCVGVIRAAIGQAFTSPACLSATGLNSPFLGAVAFVGNDAHLAWSAAESSGASVVEGASWPAAASAPTGPTDLDAPAAGLILGQLVSDQNGSVAAFWSGSATTALRVSAFDAGGPILVASNVPAQVNALDSVSLSVTFDDLWSSVTAPVSWSFGDGTPTSKTTMGAQVAHTFAAPGAYTVTATAQDALGNTTTVSFTIIAGPPAPQLKSAGQSAGRWKEGFARNQFVPYAIKVPRASKPGAKRAPVGTTFHFTLSEPAAVTFSFTRLVTGRLVGRSCRTATRANAKRHKCTIQHPSGTLTEPGETGLNTLRFYGHLSSTKILPVGDYSVALSATGFGQVSNQRTLRLTIVSR